MVNLVMIGTARCTKEFSRNIIIHIFGLASLKISCSNAGNIVGLLTVD
jgi:hypothetical protein